MIKTKIIFKHALELINTNMNAVYEAYVNRKYYEDLNVNAYNQFLIDKILNAKSIGFKKITYKEFLAQKRKNKLKKF